MSAVQLAPDTEANEQLADEFATAVAWHNGDREATIRTLLADCKHLREQLALAEVSMSVGFARGWRPCADRAEEAL
ncbi:MULTISPECIES: hypothetical protein [Ensifer]|jgi:hypothetical protein|uniref:hypothetical protein n=1 Tax=Ensifer TaxID=106591 RepID=UPI0007151ACB|nr:MULTISPECIES: hypothetical protein [Ensifer]KQX51343.1 hypothetical protein ASD49_32430 [Ensifer sp. Root1298]KQX83708.1 hypothetical protein ASD41_33045 [Ensifer sp. Root1312]KRC20053.1 hypothetical protein ASE29_32455 [Ensifer sp. Root74]KRD63300.1 hypothetical protein ASE71_31900 [Ensifer sp. Root954]